MQKIPEIGQAVPEIVNFKVQKIIEIWRLVSKMFFYFLVNLNLGLEKLKGFSGFEGIFSTLRAQIGPNFRFYELILISDKKQRV